MTKTATLKTIYEPFKSCGIFQAMVNAAGIAGVSDFNGQGRKMDEASTYQLNQLVKFQVTSTNLVRIRIT